MIDEMVSEGDLSTVIDEKDNVFLEKNIKGMMMSLIAIWNERMDRARADTEFSDIRSSDMKVFGQLRGRTLKLSRVHHEMGFSRQAGKQAIDRLVDQGMVAVIPDPQSKRDKLIQITEKGHRWRAIAAAQIRSIEADCKTHLGADETERMRESLFKLSSTLKD
jgi:DNA-binding MarR family transcriptional regulator